MGRGPTLNPTPQRYVAGTGTIHAPIAVIAGTTSPAATSRIREQNSRNKKRREIERALGVLEHAGRLRRETRHAERGRAAEVWIPILAPAA
jgi:hypothetical protein